MEEIHAHPDQGSALQQDDSTHYDEASASVSSTSVYDHPGEPHSGGGAASHSGSEIGHQPLNPEPAGLDLPEEEEEGEGDEDYARLLHSLFHNENDEMFLFEDDGEGLDPTYDPADDSGDDSDDDVEEIQITERELQRLLTESEEPPRPKPTAASSRSSSQLRPVLPRVDVPILQSTLQGVAAPPPPPASAPGAGAVAQTTPSSNNLLLKCPLKDSQRAQLAQQLTQHYQLLIQTAALLAFQTQQETESASLMEILHRHCYTNVQHLIRQLKSLRDDAWKRMGFEPGPKGTGHYVPPPPIVASVTGVGGGGMGAGGAGNTYGGLVVPRPLKRARGQQVESRRWTRHDFIRLEGHSVSLFDLPGLAAGEEMMKAIDRVYNNVDPVDEDDLEPRMEGFMADLGKAGLRIYPHRVVCRLRKGRAMILYPEHDEARQAAANAPLPIQLFTPAEQRLLVMGMQRCGDRQWGLIGVDFLPPRSMQALDWFYSVQTEVTAPPNPVKAYVLSRLASTPSTFTRKDDMALWHGVKRCGEDWHRLCREVFPRRSALELRQRFQVLSQDPPAKGRRKNAPEGQHGIGRGPAWMRGGATGQGMAPLPPAAPLPPSPGGQMYGGDGGDGGYDGYDGYDYGDDDGFQEMTFSNMSWSPGVSHSRLPSSSRSPAMGGGGGAQSRDGPWRRSLVIDGEARGGAGAAGGRPGQSRVQPPRGEAAHVSDDEYEKESIPSDEEEEEEEQQQQGRRASAGTATGAEEGSDSEYEREEVSSGDEDEEGEGEDEEFERESIGSSDGEEPDV